MSDPAVSAADRTVSAGHASLLWDVEPASGSLELFPDARARVGTAAFGWAVVAAAALWVF